MEMHSILLLIAILSVIFFLTYFINIRQKRLRKIMDKQEPRFDLINDSTKQTYSRQEQEEESATLLGKDEAMNLLLQDPLLPQKPTPPPTEEASPACSATTQSAASEEIIYLMLAANTNKPYVGYELLQALLAANLRFGAMNLFHRYDSPDAQGKILFSLASASEQGTFEINKIGAFSGKGLIMFMKLSRQKELLATFDAMLETAKQLVEDLGGDILDEQRNPLSHDKIESIKHKIYEFEQKQQTGDLFDQQTCS
jgi:cell division protein ZipA